MNKLPPTVLVIVGISGDLARRKLLPAIRQIAGTGALPEHFRMVGISRRKLSLPDVLPPSGDHDDFFRRNLELRQMDLLSAGDYEALAAHLQKIEASFGGAAQRLFYLSIPPQASRPVIELLGESSASTPRTKLLLEKPFG